MKIRKFLLSLFMVIAVVEFPIPAYSADELGDTVSKLSKLSVQSQMIGAGCAAYIDLLKKTAKDSERKEYYVSRASALGVLNRVDQFSGTPIATSEALELFLSMGAFPSGKQAFELRSALSSLSDCHAAEFYGFLTRLVHPVTQKLLTSEERARARDLVIAYVRREASGDAKPPIQTRFLTQLLSQSVSNGLVVMSLQGFAALSTLKWRINELRRESAIDRASLESRGSLIASGNSDRNADEQILEGLSEQYEQAESIRYDLQDLIEAESEQGNLLPGIHSLRPLALRQ